MIEINPATIKLPPELEGRTHFTIAEFGKLIGKTPDTIRRWGRKGWLKLQKFNPKCQMVPLSELERYTHGEMMAGCD